MAGQKAKCGRDCSLSVGGQVPAYPSRRDRRYDHTGKRFSCDRRPSILSGELTGSLVSTEREIHGPNRKNTSQFVVTVAGWIGFCKNGHARRPIWRRFEARLA